MFSAYILFSSVLSSVRSFTWEEPSLVVSNKRKAHVPKEKWQKLTEYSSLSNPILQFNKEYQTSICKSKDKKAVKNMTDNPKLPKKLEGHIDKDHTQFFISKEEYKLQNEYVFLQEDLNDIGVKTQRLGYNNSFYRAWEDRENQKEIILKELLHQSLEVEKKVLATAKILSYLRKQHSNSQSAVSKHELLKENLKAQQQCIQDLKSFLEDHQIFVNRLENWDTIYHFDAVDTSDSSYQDFTNNDTINQLSVKEIKNIKYEDNIGTEQRSCAHISDKMNGEISDYSSVIDSIIVKTSTLDVNSINKVIMMFVELEKKYKYKELLESGKSNFLESPFTLNRETQPVSNAGTIRKEVEQKERGTVNLLKKILTSLMYTGWHCVKSTIVITIAIYWAITNAPNSLS